MPRTILAVGLGTISRVQLRALARLPSVDVVAGVDLIDDVPLRFRERSLPVYSSIGRALSRHRCDTIVVSTPTTTHREVCEQLLAEGPVADILVEKPLAATLGEVEELLGREGASPRVMYHSAYAPEVVWALERMPTLVGEHGPIVGFEACYADPYMSLPADRVRAFVSSWLDSGINALSVLDRFVPLQEATAIRAVDGLVSTFEAGIAFDGGPGGTAGQGTVLTTWSVTEASKSSRLTFASGAQLVLDHTAVGARLLYGGSAVAIVGSDGAVPRLESHYLNLFRSCLADGDYRFTSADDWRLHRILLGLPAAPQ